LLAVVPEERIFALLDAIGTRDMRAAATQLTNLFRSGDRADGIVARTLVMLQRHIRLLCLAHHLGDHGYRGGPVSAELREGLSKELLSTAANQQYRLVTYMKQARNFTWLELRQAMGKILAVDMTMKGIPPMHDLPVRPLAAGDDPESLLKTLVVELCRR
jgi:DNA polymerase III delta subunit